MAGPGFEALPVYLATRVSAQGTEASALCSRLALIANPEPTAPIGAPAAASAACRPSGVVRVAASVADQSGCGHGPPARGGI